LRDDIGVRTFALALEADDMQHRVTWQEMGNVNDVIRSSVGGYPVLPNGETWPVCAEPHCQQAMALFLQVEFEPRFALSFASGSIASLFQCLYHDDPLDALDMLAPQRPYDRLPPRYWEHPKYRIFLASPGRQWQCARREPDLTYSRLLFQAESDLAPRSPEALNYANIKIGGVPFWTQRPRRWSCCCGARMAFLFSLPGDLPFPRAPGSAPQPNGRADSCFLFLGLSAYVFACTAQCDPRALLAILQN
jgi:hypothetical protein